MKRTDDEFGLRARMYADQDDDTVRLAYADWLEEHDKADAAARMRQAVEMYAAARMLVPEDRGLDTGTLTEMARKVENYIFTAAQPGDPVIYHLPGAGAALVGETTGNLLDGFAFRVGLCRAFGLHLTFPARGVIHQAELSMIGVRPFIIHSHHQRTTYRRVPAEERDLAWAAEQSAVAVLVPVSFGYGFRVARLHTLFLGLYELRRAAETPALLPDLLARLA